MVQLRVNGIKPLAISLDDYFKDRENTPKDEYGNYDFDCIDALDLELFQGDLQKLLDGQEIELPTYNFYNGKREYLGKRLKIEKGQVLLIEGIHGLNEKLSKKVDRRRKFKIYVSALIQLNLDVLTPISTTDTRLIRRIVRDFHFRGTDAVNTLERWPLVRRGEEKNIFPFQEEADAMFNTSLVYELAVLKSYVEPLLQKIPAGSPGFVEARRLLKIMQYIKTYQEVEDIPSNSILKEFIGESCFYHK
jgi:uridine kinase